MPTASSLPLARVLAPLLVATAALTATTFGHVESLRLRSELPVESDLAYLPRASLLQVASLGHPELLADLVFIRTITYFGAQFSGGKNYEWLSRHVDTILQLDPYFHGAYRFAGLATMYNGRAITNAVVHDSNRFLEAGLAHFPSDWEMAFMLGCNFLFELKTDDPAQKSTWRRRGADFIRRAAVAGGGPPWLPGLAATIMTREGEAEAAIRYLEEAYLTAPDDRTREEIQGLLSARRRDSMASLTQAREGFIAAWQRNVPYAPADLHVLLGEPRSADLDWRALLRQGAVERIVNFDEHTRDDQGAAPDRPDDGGVAP